MLGGLRVLELAGRDIWGASAVAHCGRILADLGADVVKAEPPDGDPVRRVPPYLGERAHADRGRSEERRVGKECRSRWSAAHEKKKDENRVSTSTSRYTSTVR